MASQAERDFDLLAKAWALCADPPKVNYAKLAELGGYKTAASATTAYCNAKKRFFDRMGDGGKDSSSETPKKTAAVGKKGTAKKRTAADVDGGDDDETAETKPKPRKRGGTKKAKAETQAEDDDDGAIDKLLGGARELIKAEEGEAEDEL